MAILYILYIEFLLLENAIFAGKAVGVCIFLAILNKQTNHLFMNWHWLASRMYLPRPLPSPVASGLRR